MGSFLAGRIALLLVILVTALACALLAARLGVRRRRWLAVVAVVALYLIVPAALALRSPDALDQWLLGAPLPVTVPYYLRGSYLAVEVVLPLLLVAAAILAALSWRRKQRRAIAYVGLAVLAAFTWQLAGYEAGVVGLPTVLALTHPADHRPPCAPTPPRADGAAGLGAGLGGLLGNTPSNQDSTAPAASPLCRADDTAVAGATDAPPSAAQQAQDRIATARDQRAPPDWSTFAGSHAGSAAELFGYVRDRIRLDPYGGAMRGALGTAIAGAGSPADKALMLAELLKSNGATVRFARASIDATDANGLLAAAYAYAPPLPRPLDEFIASAPEEKRAALRRQLQEADKRAQALRVAAASTHDVFVAALLAAHVPPPAAAGTRDEQLRALRDHLWVQVQQEQGWQDLDPSLPSLQAGQRLPSASQVTTTDDFPEDLQVTLELRAIATRATTAGQSSDDIVAASRRVSDLLLEPFELYVGPDSDTPPAELGKATSFRAHVHLATDDVDGDAFAIEDADKGTLLAVEVAMTVRRPGLAPAVYTRSVLDRRDRSGAVAPDWTDAGRVACALTTRLNGVLTAGHVDFNYYSRRLLDQLTATHLRSMATDPWSVAPEPADAFPMTALRYLFRSEALRPAGTRFVIDRPNIVLERTSIGCPGGAYRARAALDVVENSQLAEAPTSAAALEANLQRSAIAQTLESDLLPKAARPLDTRAVLSAAARASVPLSTLGPADSARLGTFALPGPARAAVSATLARGQWAVVTQRPVSIESEPHVAWWAIDARSGNAIGRLDDGGGQAMIDHAILTYNTMSTIKNTMTFAFDMENCGWQYADKNLEGSSFNTRACIQNTVCKLLINDSMDYGFALFEQLTDLETATELVDGYFNAADDANIFEPADMACNIA